MKKAINNFDLAAWNNQDDIDKYESLIDMCTVSDKTYIYSRIWILENYHVLKK